ncbi:MAG: hypothetical protein ABJ308_05330 [Halieaceae bacterium]
MLDFRRYFPDFLSRICCELKRMTLSNEQQAVYDWLNGDLSLPVYAEAYFGAAALLGQKSSGHVTLVAHVGRDLMNGLASTVRGIKPGRVQYQQHIDDLQDDWQEAWRHSDKLSPDDSNLGHLIPINVCQQISSLIDEHKSGRRRSSEADGLFFSTFLDELNVDEIPDNFLSEWKAAKRWFVGHAHLREKQFRPETEAELQQHFECLDGYLYTAATTQYKRLVELNEILDSTNS